MNTASLNLRVWLALLMSAVFALPASAAEIAGQFLFVVGDVRIQTAGKERPARVGDQVREGDTILTGSDGEAQLRMSDEAFVAIRRDTQLRVDQYNYRGRNDGTESGVLNLVKGTFRALTGLIVKSNRQNFTMRTAVSTIGIRGTGNITHHDANTDITTNHTVTGSHAVVSIDRVTGQPIGITIETKPGITVQVQPGRPAVVIPTPSFILAEASKDPKEKKAAPEKVKPEPRTDMAAKVETETRETGELKVDAPPPAPPAPETPKPAVDFSPTTTTDTCALSCQQNRMANLLTDIKNAKSDADTAFKSLTTYVQATNAYATSASTSSTQAAAQQPVDLSAFNIQISQASTLAGFAPSLTGAVNTAQSSYSTAYNAAGVGNTSSTLVTSQSTASTAATTAAAQVPTATAAQTAGTTAYNLAVATYTKAVAAFDAGDFALAQQLLDTLRQQLAAVQAQETAAAGAASAAASAASTASTAASTASGASGTAATINNTAPGALSTATQAAITQVQSSALNTLNQALASKNAATTSATSAATASTNATTSATSAAAITSVDLTALDAKIASATALLPYVQPADQAAAQAALSSAQSQRTTIFNAAGLGNASSTLATAQAAANTASSTAATQSTAAQTTATAANTAYTNAQNAYNAALAALAINDYAAAQTALTTLTAETNAAAASASTASTALSAAQAAATTAASQLATAQSASGAANSTLTTALANADVVINFALGNINGIILAAQTSATNAANAVTTIQGYQTSVGNVNTTIGAINLADTTPATSAINAATTAIGNASSGATQAVNAANALSLTSAQTTATSNATTATGLKTTADNQVASATTVYNANGAVTGIGTPASGTFRDASADTAFTALTTPATGTKAVLDAANTQVQSAKTTIDTQVTTLATEKAAATTALGNANTALASANTSLTTANTQNTNITNAKSAVTTDLNTVNTQLGVAQTASNSGTTPTTLTTLQATTANSPFASGCDSAATCSNYTQQFGNAAIAATPGSQAQIDAQNNAGTAATRATNFETTANNAKTAAQTASNDASAQLTTAQNALTAATSAVSAAATSAGTGATGAQGYATAANTAAANAQTANTTGTTALSTSNTNLTTVQTNATTVTQQSVTAQYRNPLVASPNRVSSVGVGANQLAAGSNERFTNTSVNKANTNYVIGPTVAGFTTSLDTTRGLVESRVTDSIALDKGGTVSSPPGTLVGTDMTVVGTTNSDYFVAVNNTAGSENYVELGRVTGGQIKSGPTVVMDLGSGATARSYHWMIGYEPPAGYTAATKLTGVTSYNNLLASTRPTDASGNVGTLNSATLSADFTNQMVSATADVTIASKNLTASTGGFTVPLGLSGTGTPQFGGPFQTVTCSGTGCSGTYNGDLMGALAGTKADGGGFVYSLFPTTTAGNPYTDLIQGAVAFLASTPPALVPQPPANIATAYFYGTGNWGVSSFQASGTTYTLDGSNNLTQVAEDPQTLEPGETAASQTLSGGTSPTQGTPVTTAGGSTITFGRWQDGTVSGVDDFSGSFGPRTVAGAYHWIKGPPVGPFYLPMALTGTVTYGSPFGMVTDQSGIAGTINVASTFSANFTTQSVNFNILASTGAGAWSGQGTNVALEGMGQFWASVGATDPHHNMTVTLNGVSTNAFGSVDGTLMGNGADAAGMAFAFSQNANRAAGTIAFTGAAQNQAAPFFAGIVAAGKVTSPVTITQQFTPPDIYAAVATPILSGTSTLPSLDAEFANVVQPVISAQSRTSRDSQGMVFKFDSEYPVAQPASCTTTCTGVTSIPAAWSVQSDLYQTGGSNPPATSAPMGSDTLVNYGKDTATGIQWGRYVGFISAQDRIDLSSLAPFDARTSNWHAIWAPLQTSKPVLPSTGTFTYTAVGGTNPTDSNGNVGTWSTSTTTLNANFTAMTVNTSVNATVGTNNWAASASNVPIVNGTYFQAAKTPTGAGNLSVTFNGSATGTAGKVTGIFTGNAVSGTNGGAMVGYSLNQGGAAGVTMQGVTAFKK